MTLSEFYNKVASSRQRGDLWQPYCEEYEKVFGKKILTEQLRTRIKSFLKYYKEKSSKTNNTNTKTLLESKKKPTEGEGANGSYTTKYSDGTLEARKIVEFSQEIFNDNDSLLEYLGFNPNEWSFDHVSWSIWEQNSKKEGLNNLYAVKFKLSPKKVLTPKEMADEAIKLLRKNIQPFKVKECNTPKWSDNVKLHSNYLLELSPIELHLGKLADEMESGENYNINVATSKFSRIINSVIEIQQQTQAEKCLVVIGNDFFNSESDGMTTNKTPQQNDVRYKRLFTWGLELYTQAITTLRDYFKKIDVIPCCGNHARSMEFFLYIALQQYFRNDSVIHFSNNYRDTQCYVFGQCSIFFNHGDANLKQLIKSIPAEFYDAWGKTYFRELHLGHLHKEVTVDDESGMITRRIGSPCNTDSWHYQNRYIGAVKKHQVFVWDKTFGLKSIQYINC